MAIPDVYSYRTGRQERIRGDLRGPTPEELDQNVREIDISLINEGPIMDSYDVEQVGISLREWMDSVLGNDS